MPTPLVPLYKLPHIHLDKLAQQFLHKNLVATVFFKKPVYLPEFLLLSTFGVEGPC